jgi:para-nitrobenzyl esterase
MNYARTVATEYGLVRGIVRDGCEEYLGIPYAQPPVGELAFKHPVPPEPWDGVKDAVRGSINPVQGKGRSTILFDGRDCLYMNIFVPQGLAPDAPVMVWFYGGSYANGGVGRFREDGDELSYDMALFAKETKTVCVNFNYRLNLEGFCNLHFLDKNFDQNNGLFDQIMALKFVRNNIHRFGGNADNVTVFGQSAGAACMLALMGDPDTSDLFDKAIVQSACVDSFWTEKQSQRLTKKYLGFLGVGTTPSELARLKDIDIALVHEANAKLRQLVLREGNSNCCFSPTIDGVTIKGAPGELAKSFDKPLLIGTTSQEGDLFVKNIPDLLMPLAAYWFKFKFRPGKGAHRYMADDFTANFYREPARDIARHLKGSSWVYEYRYQTPDMIKRQAGCCHACELPVLFGRSNDYISIDDPVSRRVGEKMREIWGEFAHNGSLSWKMFKDEEVVKAID